MLKEKLKKAGNFIGDNSSEIILCIVASYAIYATHCELQSSRKFRNAYIEFSKLIKDVE